MCEYDSELIGGLWYFVERHYYDDYHHNHCHEWIEVDNECLECKHCCEKKKKEIME